uniref:Putative ovule protein n=1 Tax=Solanum chacoense TaxID=4108 RepID=A0A0V0GVC0_SOLCH
MPHSTKEAFEHWCNWRVGKAIKPIWKMIPASIFWRIWSDRHIRCSEGLSTTNHSLKARCLMYLCSWHSLSPIYSSDNFLNFVRFLVLV